MKESPSISLRIGAGAHQGLVREENQDRISRILSPFGDVFVVADGMGGHEGGATAAQMLIDGLSEHLRALPPGTPPDAALREAAARTNAGVYRRAQQDPRLSKMGATCVLALVHGNRAWIGHAGDSRGYLWRNGELTLLTRDHTLVQRMVDNQILNAEEARHHPDSNVVTRSFGQTPDIEIEIGAPLELRDGDHLLLCSDGLSGYVDDAAIARILATGGDAQAMTDALIDLALQTGGEDNVSVQVVSVHAASPREISAVPPAPAEPLEVETVPAQKPRRGISGFLLVLPLLLMLVLAGVLLPWRDWLAPEPSGPAVPEESMPVLATPDPPDATDPFAAGPGPETGPGPDVALGTDFAAPVPPETAPATAAQRPRVTVLSPAGAQAPEVKQRVLREYPGNWSTPDVPESRPDGGFSGGRVYFRTEFGPTASLLAQELGYAAAAWPVGLAGEHPEADLLVVYGGAP